MGLEKFSDKLCVSIGSGCNVSGPSAGKKHASGPVSTTEDLPPIRFSSLQPSFAVDPVHSSQFFTFIQIQAKEKSFPATTGITSRQSCRCKLVSSFDTQTRFCFLFFALVETVHSMMDSGMYSNISHLLLLPPRFIMMIHTFQFLFWYLLYHRVS